MRITRTLLAAILCLLMLLPALAEERTAEQMLSAGRADEAIATLKAQLQSTPNANTYNLLARAYYGLQRWDEAVTAAERAVALAPESSAYHLWLGRAYGEKANSLGISLTAYSLSKKVRQEFERAVALDAANLPARTDLAEFYLEAPSFLGGGKDKARQQAQQIALKDPAAAHWVNARIAEKEKKYDLAEQEYKAAIQAATGNAGTYWLNVASFYRGRGRLAEMEDAVNQALANQTRAEVLFDAASLLFRAGRNFPGAIQAVRDCLALGTAEEAPAYRAHYLLGSILEKQGDKQAAAAEYRAALSLAREFVLAQQGLRRLGQ